MIQETTPIVAINNVVIVGTGLMGSGIAQVAIEAGVKVTMVGRSQEKCSTTRDKIAVGVQKSAKRRYAKEPNVEEQAKFVERALDNLNFATSLQDDILSEADMVLEAVVENLKVKQKLFSEIEAKVPDNCLLVTNTSSFLLEDISHKLEKRENFGGLHFFNPVPAMRLVEVIRGQEMLDANYDALFQFCKRIGKDPVKCKDSPGFIVNRLLIPYLADAMRLAEGGDAEVSDIDKAMRLGTGHPMGPFELMDYIGLDTMKFIMDGWHQRCPEDHRYAPCQSLDDLVNEGKYGRKSDKGGFYLYKK
jgi:3-hydroxyacyl-CoA dehydrogenase